jgi:hypothetical protein
VAFHDPSAGLFTFIIRLQSPAEHRTCSGLDRTHTRDGIVGAAIVQLAHVVRQTDSHSDMSTGVTVTESDAPTTLSVTEAKSGIKSHRRRGLTAVRHF